MPGLKQATPWTPSDGAKTELDRRGEKRHSDRQSGRRPTVARNGYLRTFIWLLNKTYKEWMNE